MTVVLDARVVSGAGGGPEKTILNSPRYLASMGYRTVCAYMHRPDDPGFQILRAMAANCNAPLVSIPDRGPWDWRVVRQLVELCRREQVAIWHGHDYKSNALGLVVRRFWPLRLVTTLHGWVRHTWRTPLYYWIDRVCLRHYERVICVSHDLRERATSYGVPASRCDLVENGVDTRHYRRQASVAAAKRRLGVDPARLVIGAVGRLSPEKGFDYLIEAVDRVIEAGFDIELWIAGEGDDRASLQAMIDAIGRGNRIKLLGHRTDLIDLYAAMDMFTLSSLREALPNVLLEAMALEVPVVATRVAGVPRVVETEANGLLVAPGSPDAIAASLVRLASDATLRGRLGRAGRATVEQRYSFARRMDRIRAIYDELLSGTEPRRGDDVTFYRDDGPDGRADLRGRRVA